MQVASMGQEIAEVATTCFIITLVVRALHAPSTPRKVVDRVPSGSCHWLRAAARGGCRRG